MKIRTVTSLRDFDALAPLWRDVMSQSGRSSLFLSHDWCACCWRSVPSNCRTEVWIVEDSAGPVALIPLVFLKTTIRGLPVRLVRILDSPDALFVDFLIARDFENVMEAFLVCLRERRDWDLFSITKLPMDSISQKALQVSLPGILPWRVAGREESPFVRILGTWEDFLHIKTQRFRKTCRSIENRLQRGANVSVEEYRAVDPEGPILAEVMEVSRKSWKGPRNVAMATMHGMPEFFRELTRRASANGWLHLWVLRLDGTAVATEYQLGADGTRHALRADFDADMAEISPGAYLNLHIIRSLFGQHDVQEYDMGIGLNEYKLRWASGTHAYTHLDIYSATPYGKFLHVLETRLVPVARRWRGRLDRPSS